MASKHEYRYTVEGPNGRWGDFGRRADAAMFARQQRAADRRAGNRGPVRVVKVRPQAS